MTHAIEISGRITEKFAGFDEAADAFEKLPSEAKHDARIVKLGGTRQAFLTEAEGKALVASLRGRR